jgi:hypothetical protein
MYCRSLCFVLISSTLNHILQSISILHPLIWVNNQLHLSPWKLSYVIVFFLKTHQSIEFWSLQLLYENLRVHWDSNSQGGSSLESVKVHSLTLSYTLGNMWRDSRASLLTCNLASPYLGREPKARVVTMKKQDMSVVLTSKSYFQSPQLECCKAQHSTTWALHNSNTPHHSKAWALHNTPQLKCSRDIWSGVEKMNLGLR